VTLTGTKMGEPPGYRVIVDRISHEVDYYRAFLKHAVLTGTYVINNPFWWTADDKFFNYASRRRLGVAVPKTVCCRRSPIRPTSTSRGVAAQPRLPDRLGRPARLRRPPAILKPYSGGGWKHVYKVTDRDELIAAYDGTGAVLHDAAAVHPLRQYVRCFTFGKTDIVPVATIRTSAATRRAHVPDAGARRRASSRTRRRSTRRSATR
jgi:hypothetical protein